MQLRAIDSVNTVALSRCRATEGGRNCPPLGTPCGLCYVTQLSDRLAPEVGDAAHLALVFASTSALHGSHSSDRRVNLRRTPFGRPSKSTSRSPRIRQQSTCRNEWYPRFRCFRIRSGN